MTTTTHPERVALPVCPPWCAGHDGVGYQPRDDLTDGRQERAHASEGVAFKPADARPHEDLCVELLQREDSLTGMQDPQVSLYAASRMDLTSAEARLVAAALLEAADRAEANR